jgi:hypothetical protein
MSAALPDDRLSAYLDGELDHVDRAEVDQLLASSPDARAELAAVTEIKSMLSALPLVERQVAPHPLAAPVVAAEPTAPLAPVVDLAARRRRWVLPAGIATAAACLLGVFLVARDGAEGMVPDVDQYALAHLEHSSEEMAPMADDDMPAGLPAEIGGAKLMGAMAPIGDRVHLVYSDGAADVSVFAEPGELEWSELPEGDDMMLGGEEAWHQTVGEAEVYVLERDGDVITIVADKGMGYMAEDIAEAL